MKRRTKAILIVIIILLAGLGIYFALDSLAKEPTILDEVDWTSNEMIAIYIALGILLFVLVASIVLRRTVRTRLRMARTIRADPDIHDYLVIFNWTSKILYMPTILAALIAAAVTYMDWAEPKTVGGIFFAIFLLNFVVEEYEISVKVLFIGILSLGVLFLWLHLLDWVSPFLRRFKELVIFVSPTGYLLLAIIGLLTVFISWLRGLFHYVAITPNYMNLQEGPTETGEQVGREDYNSRVDTSDFPERLMGFGKIVITFRKQDREPIILLVWRIKKKAQELETVRGKFAIDRFPSPHPQSQEQQQEQQGQEKQQQGQQD